MALKWPQYAPFTFPKGLGNHLEHFWGLKPAKMAPRRAKVRLLEAFSHSLPPLWQHPTSLKPRWHPQPRFHCCLLRLSYVIRPQACHLEPLV